MTRLWAVLTGLALLFLAAPALAAPPPDCNNQNWLNEAPEVKPAPAGFVCDPMSSIQTSGITVRVVKDKAETDPITKEMAALLLKGAGAGVPKYKSLRPSLILKNITFVILNSPTRKDQAVAGLGLGDECVIYVFLKPSVKAQPAAQRAEDLPFVAAHEIVHCTQYWNFPAQFKVGQESRGWWTEGTADYLAHTAVENKSGVTRVFETYEDGSDTKPLTSEDYAAYVFFAWYGQQKGAAAIYPFIAAMPTSGTFEAQRKALLAQVGGAEALQGFATAFVEGTIKTPQGWTLPKPKLTTTTFTKSDEKSFSAKPFAILRGSLAAKGGEYDLTATTSAKPDARFKDGDKPWGPAPAKLGAGCDGDGGLDYALMTTGSGNATLKVKAAKEQDGDGEDKCQKKPKPSVCKALSATKDACLIGTWKVNEAAIEQMLNKELNHPSPHVVAEGGAVLKLAAAGQSSMTFDEFRIVSGARPSDGFRALYIVEVDGAATGGWSTAGGQMRMCPISNTVKFDTQISIFLPTGTVKTNNTFSGSQGGFDFSYTCTGSTLVLRSAAGGGGAPQAWVYDKVK